MQLAGDQAPLFRDGRLAARRIDARDLDGTGQMTGQRFEQRAVSVGQRSWLPVKKVDIAQGLAFLKIQSGLLRDEVAGMPAGQTERLRHTLAELDTGIRESLADVRELLLHFRTRGDDEDILPALHTTLAKFQHQRGCPRTWRRMARAWPCRRMYRSRCCMRCRRRCPRPASMPVQARNGST